MTAVDLHLITSDYHINQAFVAPMRCLTLGPEITRHGSTVSKLLQHSDGRWGAGASGSWVNRSAGGRYRSAGRAPAIAGQSVGRVAASSSRAATIGSGKSVGRARV